jgi:membrane protein insertase Oxa1/YidC/SpoIIIJ|tara:strand:+ start:6895 stop:7395 length:501 start_codon:yes stop_codon:yes gene_type:complete
MTNSKANTITPKDYLFSLSIIHAALTIGVLLFTIVLFIMGNDLILGFTSDESIFIYIVPIVAMISYFGSQYLFNKQLANVVNRNTFKEKLMLYQQACIIRFAFLEGAAFLSSVSFMLTNNVFYLVISLLLILYLIKLRPTKKKVMGDLSFSLEEQQWFLMDNKEPK